jgi:VWFA-related protein
MKMIFGKIICISIALISMALIADAQMFQKNLTIPEGGTLEIVNNFGRIEAFAETSGETTETVENNVAILAKSEKSVVESEVKITNTNSKVYIEIAPSDSKKRIDLSLKIPARTNLKLQTTDGEIRFSGDFAEVEAKTDLGTIAADVPLENVEYNFLWTASRPRFVSDVELEKVKEKSAGKFVIKGKVIQKKEEGKNQEEEDKVTTDTSEIAEIKEETTDEKDKKKPKTKNQKPKTNLVLLNFTTARGIVLLNVNPNEVPSDLRERPLTNAAKAIIRSGDGLLMEAIRRASPKYFGDYAATLPPVKLEPRFTEKSERLQNPSSNIKKVLARVTDLNNRAIADLQKEDFQVLEAGDEREIISVEPTTAPFNLVLLLDVSGSVENYVDFIRKAARAFIQTADKNDKIAIVIFNEDVKQISAFTTDKGKLSETLDTFDAGGGTAFYDSIAYVLTETLRPMRGERTAVVVLTDGDDNQSFLPFDALLGSIQESGALIYPLYVPSTLIAASNADLNANIDPLRAKYMGLTTKAEGEGERLAQISGGVYYPISQLSQIQKAYDDIVLQLRTAYSITFRSDLSETNNNTTASPRLKVKVKREDAFVKLGSVIEVANISEVKK